MRKRSRTTLIAAAAGAAVFLTLVASGHVSIITYPLSRAYLTVGAVLHRAGLAWMRAPACPTTADLEIEVNRLRGENAKLAALATENEQLKAAVGYKEIAPEVISAKVVYQAADEASSYIVIDRGSAAGVAVGQPVIVSDGAIIGKVIAVSQETARVLPLTDSRSRLAVTLLGQEETIGVLEGDRGLSLSIRLIPQAQRVNPGDAVITSGLEKNIRRGLVVGTVESVERPTQEPFQTARVTPLQSAIQPLVVQVLPLTEASQQQSL